MLNEEEKQRMIPVGKEYDITVSIDPIGGKCEWIKGTLPFYFNFC
jgi:uncharacterized protein YraI